MYVSAQNNPASIALPSYLENAALSGGAEADPSRKNQDDRPYVYCSIVPYTEITMKIEIDDEIAKKCGINERESLALFAIPSIRQKEFMDPWRGKSWG